ncbi:MAG: hypothetical protein ACMG6S_05980 [Byssovorax sp.]
MPSLYQRLRRFASLSSPALRRGRYMAHDVVYFTRSRRGTQ